MNGKSLRCLVLFRLKIDCFRTVVWHNGGLPHEYMVLFSRIHSDILLFYPSIKKLWRTLVKSKRKKTYLIWRAFYFSFHVLWFGTKPPRVRVRTMFKNVSVKFMFDAKRYSIDKEILRIKKQNVSNINRTHFQWQH